MTSDAGVGQVGLNYGIVMYKVWICTVIQAFGIGQDAIVSAHWQLQTARRPSSL